MTKVFSVCEAKYLKRLFSLYFILLFFDFIFWAYNLSSISPTFHERIYADIPAPKEVQT
jgi:hypothetical protein